MNLRSTHERGTDERGTDKRGDLRTPTPRRHVVPAAVVLAAALATALSPAASAAAPSGVEAAGACTAWRSIQVNGNAAGVLYRECDRYSGLDTQTKAQLYIWDNRHDGKIAQVWTGTGSNLNGSWHQTWQKYYSWGNESRHSPLVDTGWHKGHDVKVLLKNVRG